MYFLLIIGFWIFTLGEGQEYISIDAAVIATAILLLTDVLAYIGKLLEKALKDD